ncbi:VOC family protein [Ornithinimicrobium pratense]|uniref:VOC family protein n=1 Tax=Ornithinimicrobium pratense TaxID=2593973 RepID=A0A5J6V4E7_9MICO|nr:VOC family protein [Ornithinimicrobium pratense]QFG68164.1 VOC family protein [Ornithinimicrobium pratense]
MTALAPYVYLPGTAREALSFYADVFGCSAQMHTVEEFGRTDGPPDLIAHGFISDGPVTLFAADATGDQSPFRCQGMMLSLLGAAPPETLREWFHNLAQGGQIVDDLQARPWGATDGQVIDPYGLHWLIGYEQDDTP